MITDYTYFIGELLIAGLATTAVQDSANLFIGKHEPKYLEQALGYGFAKLFSEGLAAGSPVQRWLDLKNGAEYVNCYGHTNKWPGFANSDKQSPIANYIYYWMRRNDVSFTTSIGEMEGKSDNADTVSPDMKAVRAWNEMVCQTQVLKDYLLNKKDAGTLVYPEFAIDETKCFKRINVWGL